MRKNQIPIIKQLNQVAKQAALGILPLRKLVVIVIIPMMPMQTQALALAGIPNSRQGRRLILATAPAPPEDGLKAGWGWC